jgi:spore maturation protein CgeB
VLDENNYVPTWKTKVGKGLRKFAKPLIIRELMYDSIRLANRFRPHLLFVFKGNWVHPDLIRFCLRNGILAANYYPDVSFLVHGPCIPKALPLYSHVFNTKSYGIEDMKTQLGVQNISFLEPGYDPELHKPMDLTAEEEAIYGCDVCFIGTWSPKKEKLLTDLCKALPQVRMKVWGCQWENNKSDVLGKYLMGDEVVGDEYSKAICASSICLGLLSEARKGSSSGDLITARTFQIPACGTFMLHERNGEVVRYFREEQEAAFFDTSEELIKHVNYYLKNPVERQRIADNGRTRSIQSDYAIDSRMKVVLAWLKSQRSMNGA